MTPRYTPPPLWHNVGLLYIYATTKNCSFQKNKIASFLRYNAPSPQKRNTKMKNRWFKKSDIPDRVFDNFVARRGPISRGECCGWPGGRNADGVARVVWQQDGRRNKVAAHRLAYLLEHGEIGEDQALSRTCENVLCVNPEHIVIGRRGRKIKPREKKPVKEKRSKEYPGQILILEDVPERVRAKFYKGAKVGGEDDCWEWVGALTSKGYGKLCFVSAKKEKRYIAVHRLSYLLFNGEIPEGLVVRHTCDNKTCVNPAHLLVGSDADNAADQVERNPGSWARIKNKLDGEKIAEIKSDLERGVALGRLVHAHGVSLRALHRIRDGELDIPAPPATMKP